MQPSLLCYAQTLFSYFWLGGREVASPGLEGGQVAALRLYAAVCWPRNAYIILLCEGWRITQMQYLLQRSSPTSENSAKRKFAERGLGELRRISLPRTRVNKGRKKGRGCYAPTPP